MINKDIHELNKIKEHYYSNLNNIEKALKNININIMNKQGYYIDFSDIFYNIIKTFYDMNKKAISEEEKNNNTIIQVHISEVVAGKRYANIFLERINNYHAKYMR